MSAVRVVMEHVGRAAADQSIVPCQQLGPQHRQPLQWRAGCSRRGRCPGPGGAHADAAGPRPQDPARGGVSGVPRRCRGCPWQRRTVTGEGLVLRSPGYGAPPRRCCQGYARASAHAFSGCLWPGSQQDQLQVGQEDWRAFLPSGNLALKVDIGTIGGEYGLPTGFSLSPGIARQRASRTLPV